MIYYELVLDEYDYESGRTSEVLLKTTNDLQINSLCEKLQKKYGSKNFGTEYSQRFRVNKIDTDEIKEFISKEMISSINNRFR